MNAERSLPSIANIINTLPQTIIESILCLLPIQEAARTSILSREWRYKWTTIPILVFRSSPVSETITEPEQTSDIAIARKNMDHRCKLFYAIQQVLLLHQGPIHEFTLVMDADCHCVEIDQIILHLSRNHTVKKLSLELNDTYLYKYKLPLSVFSLHHLTNLHLCYCDLDHKPTFSGFRSLRSLFLLSVNISTKGLLRLLSSCPSLKSFTQVVEQGNVVFKDCTVIELFECLPAIERFTVGGCILPGLVDSIPKELPTSLIHLKYFWFHEMCFDDGYRLTFLAVLINCSPNLEKIELWIDSGHTFCLEHGICPGLLEEYSDVCLEHLKELEIASFSNLKSEMEFVKFILARSPKLEKVTITTEIKKNQEFEVLLDLLQGPRASPAEIVVHYWGR